MYKNSSIVDASIAAYGVGSAFELNFVDYRNRQNSCSLQNYTQRIDYQQFSINTQHDISKKQTHY